MPSLLSSRRAAAAVTLRVTSARKNDVQATRVRRMRTPISWTATALIGGAVTALASWILCVGVTILGWLAANPGSVGDAAQLGSRLWLLSNGVAVRIGSIPVTLVPWGATAVIALMISRFAAASARRLRRDQIRSPLLISAVTVAVYLLPVLLLVTSGSRQAALRDWHGGSPEPRGSAAGTGGCKAVARWRVSVGAVRRDLPVDRESGSGCSASHSIARRRHHVGARRRRQRVAGGAHPQAARELAGCVAQDDLCGHLAGCVRINRRRPATTNGYTTIPYPSWKASVTYS